MASTRAMTAASAEYYRTIAAARQATGEEAAELTAQVAKIGTWLESAMLGYSDRDCEWHADGYAPVVRRMRRATTQLMEAA